MEHTQRLLIVKIRRALSDGGSLVFTAPQIDVMTGREPISLGLEEYQKALESEGISLVEVRADKGENNYYVAVKGT